MTYSYISHQNYQRVKNKKTPYKERN